MQFSLLLWLATIAQLVAAFEPKVSKTELDARTLDTLYFDDTSHIIAARSDGLWVSYNDGQKWEQVKLLKGVDVKGLSFDPYDKNRAFAFTESPKQYYTTDKGKTWQEFEISEKDRAIVLHEKPRIHYNAADAKTLMFELWECPGGMFSERCKKHYFYTSDGLKLVKRLPVESPLCVFAKNNNEFEFSGDSKTIICAKLKLNAFGHVMESSVVQSTNFFKSENEILTAALKKGRILDVRVDSAFMVVTMLNDRFNLKSHISFFVSKNGQTFEKANFDLEVSRGAIQFLPSSKLALFLEVIKVQQLSFPITSIWKSDSMGINFQEIAEMTLYQGTSKIENFDGVWITPFLTKAESPEDSFFGSQPGTAGYTFTSKITLNDGQEWDPLRLLDDDDCKIEKGCSLNLVGINMLDGSGRVTTGPTANIVMGIGNAGRPQRNFDKMSTFISRDGGMTWKKAIDAACAFAYGDQGNVILAVPIANRGSGSKSYYYSLDQGNSWQEANFDSPILPLMVTTTIDGTGTKFFIASVSPETKKEAFLLLDFSDAFGGAKCLKNDFEKVYARVQNDNPLCTYGHKESIMRRKQDAKCFVSKLFEDIKVTEEPCECTDIDFECTKYFTLSPKGACVPNEEKIKEACAAQRSKKIKLPDKQLVAGNLCKANSKQKYIAEEEFDCKDYSGGDEPLSKKLVSVSHEIEGRLLQYSYIKTADDNNENLLVRTSNNVMYASNNGGLTFVKVPVYEKIQWFTVGGTPGSVVMITDNEIFYLSNDGGNTFQKLNAPSALAPTRGLQPSFHPQDEKQFIWYGSRDCDPSRDARCEVTAYYTIDGGADFKELIKGVQFCDYISLNNSTQSNLIYCLTSGTKSKLVSSEDYFRESEPKVLFDNVASYALKSNFVIVATILEELKEMRAKVTVDGKTFADALFPKDFKVEAQTAYNILDSSDHSIFMHVTTDTRKDHEVGSILKSNSNGTSYVLALQDVNRGRMGFVDYDRIQALEGVILTNIVANSEANEKKKLKTMISFNDGSEWNFLSPPMTDSEGKKTACSGQPLEKCSLHLQGFTERPDYTDTYGSSSAVGVLFGVGNVGEYLGESGLATYMSNDAGLTWREVKKGQFMWEFGDQGTVLLMVDQLQETTTLQYSTDGGDNWQEYKFSEKSVFILDLATVQTDTSLKFVIFAADRKDLQTTYAYSIDFTKYFSRQCQLNLEKPDADDFEFWSPKRPFSKDNCLFGSERKYLRRKKDHSDCFIGGAPLKDGFKEWRICECTRADYECDYNYYRDSDGTCKLVKGLSPADRMKEMCAQPGTFQYFEPTGYRKLPLSKCEGGKEFDSFKSRACPGHEDEYNKYYNIGFTGGRVLGVIFAPFFIFIAAFLFASWFVYDRGIRRNGGFQRLGQIRLDDDDDFQPIEENAVDVVVNKIVKGGVVVVAGTIATLKTIRKVDRAMFDRLSLALFGRRPGRRNYVRVPEEEDELFGNVGDSYEDELENDIGVNFDVEDEPEEFTEYTDEPPVADESAADGRLFDIDDQSDEDGASRRAEE